MTSTYDLRLVLFSILLAIVASYTSLALAGQVTTAPKRTQSRWLIGGALVMGIGIWSMHFVGMLAFCLPVPLTYNLPRVLLSVLITVLASGIALFWVSRTEQPSLLQLMGGGIVLGLAIASMHYLGMIAMRVQAHIQYNWILVALSVAIAICASCLALWLAFKVREQTLRIGWKLGGALIMGVAICGMHYTGMKAARFLPTSPIETSPSPTLDTQLLATGVGIATLIILSLTLLVLLCDKRTALQALQASQESERRLETLIKGMQVGVLLIGPQTEILLCNQTASRLLGLTESQLLSKTTADPDWRVIHEDSSPFPSQNHPVQQAIATRQLVQDVVMGAYNPTVQDWVWLIVSADPQLAADGSVQQVIYTLSDITERKRAKDALARLNEELENRVKERTAQLEQKNQQLEVEIVQRQQAEDAIRESEGRFRQLAENIHEVFWMSTTHLNQLHCVYVSPAFEDVWGRTRASLYAEATTWIDAIHPDDRQQAMANFQSGMDQEYRIVRPDGSIRWIRDRAFPVKDETGQIYRFAGIAEDITVRKQAEAEIYKALQKEKELSELKSHFITMTSHEFRTPLCTILSSADLLELYGRQWTEEKRLEHLQRIQTAVQRMTHLLDDVLLIGQAEAGKLEFKPSSLDLDKFCGDLVTELQLSTGSKHTIAFVKRGQCTTARMDEKLLRHIFSNLLSNAIKYSLANSTVHFEVNCQDGEAKFRIRDQGLGIPEEDQQRLFEAFGRAKNVGTIPGTGLGLAIVKKAVDLHGGQITVESKVGVGTTFTVRLPLINHVLSNNELNSCPKNCNNSSDFSLAETTS
jgi:PAS domain S-box-containing protein